jgi:hypothetical protein
MSASSPHSVPRTDAEEWVDRVNWYVACLENVIARKVVRGLAEAEAGFDAAIDETVKELERLRSIEEQLETAQGALRSILVQTTSTRIAATARAALEGVSSPADSPNGEQTREQLLERLALTVKEAIDGGSFDGTLFETQVSGTLWLLYGERDPASEPHEHEWSLPVNAGVYRCMTCGIETVALPPNSNASYQEDAPASRQEP